MATLVKEQKMFGGIIKKFTHDSVSTRTKMTFSVFFPQKSATSAKFPILIYLSGLTCTDDNVMQKSFIQYWADHYKIAVVAPDTSPRGLDLPEEHSSWDFGSGAGFYVDSSTEHYKANYNMFSYVLELCSFLKTDSAFEALDTSRKSITGHSMGGHGAIMIGLRNAAEFQSISAFAPICNPINCPWGKKAFTGYLGENVEEWKKFDSCEVARNYAGKKVKILVDQGTTDEFYVGKQLLPENLKDVCKENDKIDLDLRFQTGFDHSYFFIATFMKDHLEFHSKYLKVILT